MTTRRDFLKAGAAGISAASIGAFPFPAPALGAPFVARSKVTPVVIASSNGLAAVNKAAEILAAAGDTLEAVVRGVNIVELDPADITVGYGGLPNALGVTQLDASVMHGPTRGAGAVGSLEGCKTPSLVAVAVMRYTDHVMLVGPGARQFAREMGFAVDDELLTEESRREFLEWRAKLSPEDDYLTPDESGERVRGFTPGIDTDSVPGKAQGMLDSHDGVRPWGTINCNAVDRNGNISGVTTTSGLFFKIPGRVGDSPIIGAGLYTDNDVGSAGSTGRGEACIKICGGHTIVENMRRGLSPTDACMDAVRRVVTWTVEKRLQYQNGRPNFNINFYAVNKKGEYGAAAIYSGARYTVNVDGRGERKDSAYLFARPAQ
ncbi:MAG: N(4)-(beta-N-acetylglucosaminyl)-L-asparaginase [Gemmatimonadota bacterium]